MECEACGFDGYYKGDWGHEEKSDWPELRGMERGPFTTIFESVYPNGMTVQYREGSPLAASAREVGKPVTIFACPRCGTLKIEI